MTEHLTENLLQRLEEKVLQHAEKMFALLAELETLRNENRMLKEAELHRAKKLEDILSLFGMESAAEPVHLSQTLNTVKPLLVQG